jgi:hypothetical protein
MTTSDESAYVSVTLPVSADVPARYAVPVQVRLGEGSLVDVIPADGRYHPVSAGSLTFVAVLPQSQVLQASAELPPRSSVRITLQGDAGTRGEPFPLGVTFLERGRTALRFYAQSSIDAYRRSSRFSPMATALAPDELKLRLDAPARKVHFLQLLSPGLLPMNVAHIGETMRVARLEQALAADLMIRDERVELASQYLRYGQPDQAATILDLQNIVSEGRLIVTSPAEAVICLQILLAATREYPVEDMALGLAQAHPSVSDFHVVSAECAARRGDDTTALDRLARLRNAGLPLLYRSYVQATVRLARHAPFEPEAPEHHDSPSALPANAKALLSVHERLQAIKQYVDPASSLLVIRGRTPGKTATSLPAARRMAVWFARIMSRYQIRFDDLQGRKFMTASTVSPTSNPTGSDGVTAKTADRGSPSRLAVITAVVALLVWAGFAGYLLYRSSSAEVQWTRIAWVFSSVEAVAFAAAGLIFGTTVNRQQAQQAEARANANQNDAEAGRALAAALKADEPPVAYDGPAPAGGPQALGQTQRDDAASQLAARHARLARQLFP